MSIIRDVSYQERGAVITPYVGESMNSDEHGNKVPSYGQGGAGYDLRVSQWDLLCPPRGVTPGREGWIIASPYGSQPYMEPLTPRDGLVVIPPYRMVRGLTLETVAIPDDILGMLELKSTYMRQGLLIATPPAEPGFNGRLSLFLSNPNPWAVGVVAAGGIAQLISAELDGSVGLSYGSRPTAAFQGAAAEGTARS